MKEYSVFKIYSEELEREVRLFVSLPRSYYKTNKYYPVLYMCDGTLDCFVCETCGKQFKI